MANQEVTLMKGNEAIAHACIRCGADGFFGYPITPQSKSTGKVSGISGNVDLNLSYLGY